MKRCNVRSRLIKLLFMRFSVTICHFHRISFLPHDTSIVLFVRTSSLESHVSFCIYRREADRVFIVNTIKTTLKLEADTPARPRVPGCSPAAAQPDPRPVSGRSRDHQATERQPITLRAARRPPDDGAQCNKVEITHATYIITVIEY